MPPFEQQPNIQKDEGKAREERIKELVKKTKKIGGLDRDKPKTVPEGGMEFNEYDEIVFTLQEIIDGEREYINDEGKPESLGMTAKEVLENFTYTLIEQAVENGEDAVNGDQSSVINFIRTISAFSFFDEQYKMDLLNKIDDKLDQRLVISVKDVLENKRFIYGMTTSIISFTRRGISDDYFYENSSPQLFSQLIVSIFSLDQQYNTNLVKILEGACQKELNMTIKETLENEKFVNNLTEGIGYNLEKIGGEGGMVFVLTIPALFSLGQQYNINLVEKIENGLKQRLGSKMTIKKSLKNEEFINILTKEIITLVRNGISSRFGVYDEEEAKKYFLWIFRSLHQLIPHYQKLSEQERHQRKLQERYKGKKDLPPIPERRMWQDVKS